MGATKPVTADAEILLAASICRGAPARRDLGIDCRDRAIVSYLRAELRRFAPMFKPATA